MLSRLPVRSHRANLAACGVGMQVKPAGQSFPSLEYLLDARARRVCESIAGMLLSMDGLNAAWQLTHRLDAAVGGEYHARLRADLERVQDQDLTIGIAMTDRSKKW